MNLRQKKSLIAASIGLFVLSACNEVRSPDGKIPAEAESQVAAYLGEYEGEFDGQPGKLILSIEDLKPKVTFTSRDGATLDLIDPSCGSQIGDMWSYKVKETDPGQYELKKVIMRFDPGSCTRVEGRGLTIKFKQTRNHKTKIELSIFSHTVPGMPQCVWSPTVNYCWDTTVQIFLDGQFKKVGSHQ